MTQILAALRGVGKSFKNGTLALTGLDLDVAGGRVSDAAWAVRLRQIHDPALDRGIGKSIRGQYHPPGSGAGG